MHPNSRAMDKSKLTLLVLLDQSKAFDLVNFRLLLSKLHFIGFSEKAIDWFRDYLYRRKQTVKYNQQLSQTVTLRSGVPQGSILGPLLFSLFIFDLCDSVQNCEHHMYADDLQIYKSFSKSQTDDAIYQVNSDLHTLNKYCTDNGLRLNPAKTLLLCIGTPQMRGNFDYGSHTVYLAGVPISYVESGRNLGVTVDVNLNFDSHVNRLYGICLGMLRAMHHLKPYLPEALKLKLVKTLIYPKIDYGSSVYYYHLTQSRRDRLQRVQNSAMRFVSYIPFGQHVTPVVKAFHELNLKYRFKFVYLTFLKKLMLTGSPTYLKCLIRHRSHVYSRPLREVLFDIPAHRSAKFEGSFSYMAVYLLNKFKVILAGPTEANFRRELTVYLFEIFQHEE